MVLEFAYGVNISNRFITMVDHDEDPEVFVSKQTPIVGTDKDTKKPTKDTKQASKKSTTTVTKTTTTATTKPAIVTTTNQGKQGTKSSTSDGAGKENVGGGKSNETKKTVQATPVFSDNNNKQQRDGDQRRGQQGDRPRRGDGQRRGTGEGRPPYEGGNREHFQGEGGQYQRGGGQQQRYVRFNRDNQHQEHSQQQQQGQTNEPSGFTVGGETWGETDQSNQDFGGNFRGGRGNRRPRGSFEGGSSRGRGNFESGRGTYEGGRGRGRGRGNYPRTQHDDQQQSQQQQPDGSLSQEASFETERPPGGENDDVTQERPFETEGFRRGGRGGANANYRGNNNRGNYGSRVYRNQQFGSTSEGQQYSAERSQDANDDYRHQRRNQQQYDRHTRNPVTGVKAIEKKDGAGSHNWGTHEDTLPDDRENVDDANESKNTPPKNWSEQVDEAEKQMTLDEYKKTTRTEKKNKIQYNCQNSISVNLAKVKIQKFGNHQNTFTEKNKLPMMKERKRKKKSMKKRVKMKRKRKKQQQEKRNYFIYH